VESKPDHYDVLGVTETVDLRELRAAYLARMRVHHPDARPGDPGDHARAINHAYEVLRDPARRAAYDRARRARRPGPPSAPIAYSDEYRHNYQRVSVGLLRIGAAIFAVGFVVLLFTG
jgi:curved DNA-binding protein CbpA